MNVALQSALTTLVSICALYMILAVVGRAMVLFFEIKNQFNREKDIAIFAKAIEEGMARKKDDTIG